MSLLKKISDKSKDYGAMAPVKIALLGDSVTHGCFEIYNGPRGIETVYDFDAVYHARLHKLFAGVCPSVPVSMINAGVSGADAKSGLARLERDILSCSLDLVVICFGLNDVMAGVQYLQNYKDSLEGIFRELNSRKIDTIFMTPNMINTYVSPELPENFAKIAQQAADRQNDGTMDKYMNGAREVCDKNGISVCDCYAKWKYLYDNGLDTTQLLSNYINHPTREMHQLFATSLFDMMIW